MFVENFEGTEGNRMHITRIETGEVNTKAIAHLPGACGEVRGNHSRRRGKKWDAFKKEIAENGITERITIFKDPGEEAVIREGNHRLDAALELGLETVPVEIRYFGHSERTGLVTGHPEKHSRPKKMMGVESELVRHTIIDGVSYELYAAVDPDDTRSTIRVFDIDSGEVVTIEQHKTFGPAEKLFDETISALDDQEFSAGPGM